METLIIFSRDNEVDQNLFLVEHLQFLVKKKIKSTTIHLKSLELSDVNALLSETLRLPINTVEPLSNVVFVKTKGNPFFVGRFLNALYSKSLLVTEFALPFSNF
jgi:predicted ATPase